MAALEARTSAAFLMSLALSTSALAWIILDSPILLASAAIDSELETPGGRLKSLISKLSTLTPQLAAGSAMISSMDWAISSLLSIASCKFRAPSTCDGDVVLGVAGQSWDLHGFQGDVRMVQLLAQWVDFGQSRVNRLVQLTKLGNKTDITLINVSVRVREAEAARNGTEGSKTRTNSVDQGPVPAIGWGIPLECIRGLEVFSGPWLFCDHGACSARALGLHKILVSLEAVIRRDVVEVIIFVRGSH
ncbi:hypothetical protein OGAPHI_002718 [Ogataea philodendri]|uniref:Uncharacterized protein n=1 Tax=Ogataea philodendri TaxID=1378263 RepID=A0A9P8PB10_9ASCO|nr:uncharacterized protein OGAPHI_002718 [Ogataea philodendri]KAH3668963.1 hypothetical protein OGAPHI_002718 [Ogataea philodendri]